MCGREPNFELSEEDKLELSQYNWEEFLSMTRNAITSKSKWKYIFFWQCNTSCNYYFYFWTLHCRTTAKILFGKGEETWGRPGGLNVSVDVIIWWWGCRFIFLVTDSRNPMCGQPSLFLFLFLFFAVWECSYS